MGCLELVAGFRVQHARTAIVKPLSKSQQASKREVDDAMKKVKEAHSLISAAAGGEWQWTLSMTSSQCSALSSQTCFCCVVAAHDVWMLSSGVFLLSE